MHLTGAQAVHVRLEEPLSAVRLEEQYRQALLVVTWDTTVLGEVLVPAAGVLGAEAQERAIEEGLGGRLWEERLAREFTRSTRRARVREAPVVSLVVDASGDAELLLQRAAELDPPSDELIVVGGESTTEHDAPADALNRAVAEARGDIVAFAHDYILDRRWLAGLAEAFEDRLVTAVAGHTAPLELETDADCRRHLSKNGARELRLRVWDRFSFERARLPHGPSFVRRQAFVDSGGFAARPRGAMEDDLHQRLVAGGWRVSFRPEHLAWRRPGQDVEERRRLRKSIRAGGAPAKPAAPAAPARVVEAEDPPMSLAIASYNRREPLAKVLEALGAQTYPADRFEAVVVLDGSSDGSAERVRAMDLPFRVVLVEQENRGLAVTRNRGAREATAPVVAFLDDDIYPEPQFMAEHARAHRDASGHVVALGTCPPANPGRDLPSLAVRHWWEDYYRRRSEPDHQWNYTDFGDGNVSFPRAVLDASGGWDEDFAARAGRRQDWELGIRLIKQGVRFADVPAARGMHHFDTNLENALRHRRVDGRGDVLLGQKHPEARAHLSMVAFMRDDESLRRRDFRFLAGRPGASRRILRLLSASASTLERAHAERAAWRLMLKLIGASYLLGVRDQLPTEQALREFLAPVHRGELTERLPVHLDRTEPIDLPPMVGAVELVLDYDGHELGAVDAFEPEGQWDWDAITWRVLREAAETFSRIGPGAVPSGSSS